MKSNSEKSTLRSRPWFENRIFMLAFDTLFANVLVTNLVIFVWRIIWDVQDLYLKHNLYLNSIISIVLSFTLIFYIKYKQFVSFKHNMHVGKCEAKLFIIVFAFANINHWRGVWNFTLAYTNQSLISVFSIGAISILGLVFMNRLCALVSVPFILNKDCMQAAYQISPSSNRNDNYLKLDEYRLKMTKWLFLLNSIQEYFGDLFTIQSWRSLWFFMDIYLYPNNTTKSALTNILIGIVVYLFLHTFAKPINRFVVMKRPKHQQQLSLDSTARLATSSSKTSNDDSSNRRRLGSKMPSFAYFNKDLIKRSPIINIDIRENYEKKSEIHFTFSNRILLYLIFILGFLGTVSTWRGIWLLQMLYAYPSTYTVPNQMCLNIAYISVAVLILWFLNLTSSLLSRASCKDDYFTAKKVYVIRFNNYKAFLHNKFTRSTSELLKMIKVKLMCPQVDKDGLKIQEMVIPKSSIESTIIKLHENCV